MSNKKSLLKREQYENLLAKSCVNALDFHKTKHSETYQAEINALSKICDYLITYYNQTLPLVIDKMEKVLAEAHDQELQEIDKKIKQLFNARKQLSGNNSFYEGKIIEFTTKIHLLEARKTTPVKDTIQEIIYESLDHAINKLGTNPGEFNLTRYRHQRPIQ